VYNGAQSLGRCLQAVAASKHSPYECIVVDDGSTDDSRPIARQFPVRRLEISGGPFGPAYARNRGAEAASGEILCFLDSDVVIRPDTLTEVAGTFVHHPQIDAVFGSYDDTPEAARFISQYKNLVHHFVHQQASEEAATFWAGCGAIRREVFFAVGGFDQHRYPRPSIEDIELGYRLRRAGHRIMLNKRIQVKHLKRWTVRGMIKSDILDRGIPWTDLILRDRCFINDLNLRPPSRVSVVLTYALPAACIAAWWWPASLAVGGVLMGALLVLNAPVYRFFLEKRGFRFALQSIPWHWLYYFYSGLAFGLGVARHLAHGRRTSAPDRSAVPGKWVDPTKQPQVH
jgi:glycosyltransferase involved in cell wall biosynthesis